MERRCGSSRSSSWRSLPWWERGSLIAVGLWILIGIPWALLALAVVFAGGCGRVVLVPESSPMRIGPDCRTRVYVMTGSEWKLSENRIEIPEGWYVVPPSFVEEPER